VAGAFGGRGHERAAGCTVAGDAHAVRDKIVGAFSL